jgi:hypothetical protein
MSALPPDERLRLLDQQVLAILRTSGGWNAQSRMRLAAFAESRRLPLEAVIASALRVAGSVPAVPAPAAGAGGGEVVTGPTASTDGAFAASAPTPPSRGIGLLAGVAVLMAACAASVWLVWYAVDRAAAPMPVVAADDGAEESSLDGASVDADSRTSDGLEAPSRPARGPGAPNARDVPPVPAMYARPPVLRPDPSPAWAQAALETVASLESPLAEASARLAAGGAATDADRDLLGRACDSLASAWPLMESRRRDDLLADLCRIDQSLVAVRGPVRESLESLRASSASDPAGMWRSAGAAGILASLEGQSSGTCAASFAPAALGSLAPRMPAVADAILSAAPGAAADTVDAWIVAIEAATSGDGRVGGAERDARILALIEVLLRRSAPLGRPGTPADAAGTLLDALGWTASSPRRRAIAAAFRGWLEDPDVSSGALHGLTSVLAARRPGRWWDPWMVSDARADRESRRRTADRFDAALAAGDGEGDEPDAPRLRGVPQDVVDDWVRVARMVESRRPGPDAAERLVAAAERVALVEAARLLERGLVSEARARVMQVEDPAGLALDPLDRWRGRREATAGRAPTTDGRLAAELSARASFDDRVALLRALRTRAAGDLGPLDAATLAHEALRSASRETRVVAQGVVVDAYGSGPNVIAALASQAPAAADPSELAAMAAMVTGMPAPRGNPEQVRRAALLMLLDRHAELSPSDRHRIDSVSTEFALSAAAAARAAGALPAEAPESPEAAFRRWLEARVAEARPVVPAPALAAIVERAASRRGLAAPGPQRMVAEHSSLVELDAAILAERMPRRRAALESIVRRASAERGAAPDVFAQVEANARASLAIALVALAREEEAP